jgi:peptide/nickel transport system permease protein
MDQGKTGTQAAVPAEHTSSGRGIRLHIPEWFSTMLRNRKAVIGMIILLFFTFLAAFAPQLTGTNTPIRIVAQGRLPPGSEYRGKVYILGTTQQGQDVLVQMIHGARTTLVIGFLTGAVITVLSIIIGISAGYLGGVMDDLLSMLTNVFLILPGLPLIIVVAGWLNRPGPFAIVLVLSITGWAYNARVFRSQTLVLRNSEFVAAARVAGEPNWRIILFEILPNMTSLVVSGFIGTVIYAILAEAGLEFIGLGDANAVTWGTILYWAQQNQALLVGQWWTFIPPGACIALVGLSLTLINYAIDELTNPRLRSEVSEEEKKIRRNKRLGRVQPLSTQGGN